MKKSFGSILLYILIFIFYCYLLSNIWETFGFWTIILTNIISFSSGLILGKFAGARSIVNGVIIYNPKEWPKYLYIFICASIGYYLYSKIAIPGLNKNNYYFGLVYLILLSVIPIIWSLYKITRDRNDYVQISTDKISYRDNKNQGSIEISNIKNIEYGKTLILQLKDNSVQSIDLKNMNFNLKDITSLISELQEIIPKSTTDENIPSA